MRREFAFTARFAPAELPCAVNEPAVGEFEVVQGTADLVGLLPDEIWLVDFKMDDLTRSELGEKLKLYEPRLRPYAQAFSRIYRRPVTKLHLHFLSIPQSIAVKGA